jgi:hypothetical protein
MVSHNNGKGSHGIDVYYGLVKVAQKYGISWKEAEETVLRVALRKMKAMEYCDHKSEDIIVRRDGSKPHCRKCWTWVEETSKRTSIYPGEFRPLTSRLEEELEMTLEFGIGEDQT